jgi:hypothetical protein
MKLLAGSILILLVLFQAFSKWVIMAEYTINQDYIAKNLCENKARPMLHCNGKCQLMKKLAEEEKQNSSNSNTGSNIKVSDVLFTHEIQTLCITNLPEEKTRFNSELILSKSSAYLSSIFHPPAII